jgi:hypothetical protein
MAVLALATLGLAIATRGQVQLAREDFIATNWDFIVIINQANRENLRSLSAYSQICGA